MVIKVKINREISKPGEFIVDFKKINHKILRFSEDVSGVTNNNIILKRFYSFSKDNKNWNLYKEISYGWLEKLEVGDFLKVKYVLEMNLTNSIIEIRSVEIENDQKEEIIEQGESVLLSKITNPLDYGEMSKGMIKLETDLNYLVNNLSPIEVMYWHTNPDVDTTDVFLKEYSLHNIVKSSAVKVVVKDNQIPEPKHEFSQWGIEFEKLEIYIEKTYFEEIFGVNEYPRSYDYIYFKEINRMYFIEDQYLGRGVNEDGNYHTLVIKKYVDVKAVDKDEESLDFIKNSMLLDDDLFEEEIQKEQKNITNISQTLPVDVIYDVTKEKSDIKLEIIDHELFNKGNLISRSFYSSEKAVRGEKAITYNEKLNLSENDGISIMFWMRLKDFDKREVEKNNPLFLINGNNDFFKIENLENGISLNSKRNNILFPTNITKEMQWTCCVISINNQHSFASLDFYRFNQVNDKSTRLIPFYHETTKLDEKIFIENGEINLLNNNLDIRCIRISNYCIQKDYHSYIMSSMDIKKASSFIVIDDCIANEMRFKKGKSQFPISNINSFKKP